MDITYVVLRVSTESHRYIIRSLILIHACTIDQELFPERGKTRQDHHTRHGVDRQALAQLLDNSSPVL